MYKNKNAMRICKHCNKEFMTYQAIVNRSGGYYCSRSCQAKGRTKPPIEIFWRNIIKNKNGCWEYQVLRECGYGQIYVNDRLIAAHRYSFLIHKGEIPAGILVCHHCDNRKCVNPNHLFLGTYKDNSDDMKAKSRERKAIGLNNKSSKLNIEKIKQIKELLAANTPLRKIASSFEVTHQTILAIKQGKNLSYVN